MPIHDLPPLPEVDVEKDVRDMSVTSATEAGEEVVVGASKREQSLGTVASAVTVISADRLRRWGYRTVHEALRGVVGLHIVDDHAVERLGIRGIQLLGDLNTRVLVLIDGTPINEPWQQFVDTGGALPVLLDEVSRIEVIRGPVSSIYGTNAFFGIINIVTLDADEVARAHGRLDLGSFDQVGASATFAAGNVHRQVRGFVGANLRGGERLRYPEYGPLPPDFDDTTSADRSRSVAGGVVVHHDQLFLQVRAALRDRMLPGAPYDARFGSEDNRNIDRIALVEAGYARELPHAVTVTGRLFANHYLHRADLDFSPNPSFRSRGTALWFGGELRAVGDLSRVAARVVRGGQLGVTAGTDVAFTRTMASSFDPGAPTGGTDAVDVERSFDIQGLYTEIEGRAPVGAGLELGVTAGARYDRNSEFENNLSPRAALFLNRGNRYGAKLLYAEGFRNPSVFEAFFEDNQRFRPTCSPACATIGTTLSPEQIRSLEAVVWGRPMPGLKARVSVWHWTLDRLIEKIVVFDPQLLTNVIQFGNIFLDFTSRGAELEVSYRDTRGWLGVASATAARVTRGNDRAVNTPELTAKLGVSTPRLGDRVHLSSELLFIGERPTREAGTLAGAHATWNAALYLPEWRGIDVTLGIRNILGTREQIPAQADYDRQDEDPPAPVYTVPGAGRELFARLGYAF